MNKKNPTFHQQKNKNPEIVIENRESDHNGKWKPSKLNLKNYENVNQQIHTYRQFKI